LAAEERAVASAHEYLYALSRSLLRFVTE
jgi:hypothetical protein